MSRKSLLSRFTSTGLNATIDTDGVADRGSDSGRHLGLRSSFRRVAKTFAAGCVVASVVGAGVCVGVDAAGAAGGWVYGDRNGDRYYDVAGIDSNGDGTFDVIWGDSDFDRDWDVQILLQGRWSRLTSTERRFVVWTYSDAALWSYIDEDGNGRYERLTYDGNRDGVPEWALIDNNRDGSYDGNWISLKATTGTATMIIGGGSNTLSNNVALNQLVIDHNKKMVDIWLR